MELDKDEIIKNLQETVNKLTRVEKTCKNNKEEMIKHCHDRERRMRASFSKQLADMNIRNTDMADRLNIDRSKFLQDMEQLLVKERQATVDFSEQSGKLVLKFQGLQHSNDILTDHNANLQDLIKKMNSK